MTARIPADVRAFAEAQRLARLATVDDRGRPHVVPVCFALAPAPTDTVYTAIDEKPKRGSPTALRRVRNIAADPNVQLLLDLYDDADWSRLRYVQLRGRAAVLAPEGDEHARAVALLRARYPQYRDMDLETRPVIAVRVHRVVGWRAGHPPSPPGT